MSQHQRVLWGEGLFLRPQHFQYQDLYHDSRLREALADAHPYAWGLKRIRVERDALANGVFRLNALSAILPDGEVFDAPEPDALPPALALDNIPEATTSVIIYAGLPRLRDRGGNVAADAEQARQGLTRYFRTDGNAPDMFTDAADADLAFLGRSLRLLTDDKPRDEYVSLPIARLERASTGGFQLDDQFVPPVFQIGASEALIQRLRRLLDALQAKIDSLYGHHREPAQDLVEFRSGDIASFWLLHTASSAFAGLSHLLNNPGLSPERLFQRMLELAGALMTFSTRHSLADLPAYDHEEPGHVFDSLSRIVRDLLEAVISERYIRIPLQESRPSYHVGQLNSDRINERTEFYLAVGADLSPAELVEIVPLRFKVGAPDDVERCVLSALPGVKLIHTPQVPSAVPVRAGQSYFSLSVTDPLFERMLKAGSIMIYVPSGIRELKLDLVAVV
ncbi:type VI secretion system baseplate subunit TssK [Salinisphaera sp. Q1T1-3]|uniref:type VI secretion system baseplate subunit TssK n=1 Tax=Salinisphaera sp. Q1T1-3 TaxID=2321229 RepID=UPI000E763566|nr:type VI secretion system baseplate subunit TssK [Salinisphaera sp. Q1T1-3]RJS91701.1 type VI secretion system baseplate subunit TssK [Salinisphaera sp. Q1T1-3]